MPDEKTTKNKHLTYEERQDIQECLDKGVTFKSIGQRLGKAATTISREVKNHLSVKPLDIT